MRFIVVVLVVVEGCEREVARVRAGDVLPRGESLPLRLMGMKRNGGSGFVSDVAFRVDLKRKFF